MYISKIKIKNFRNFKEKEVEFKEGINVLIWHNNSGKTDLLKALALILDYQGTKRLGIDDLYKSSSPELLTELRAAAGLPLHHPSRLQFQIFIHRIGIQVFGGSEDGLDAVLFEFFYNAALFVEKPLGNGFEVDVFGVFGGGLEQ